MTPGISITFSLFLLQINKYLNKQNLCFVCFTNFLFQSTLFRLSKEQCSIWREEKLFSPRKYYQLQKFHHFPRVTHCDANLKGCRCYVILLPSKAFTVLCVLFLLLFHSIKSHLFSCKHRGRHNN